MIPTEICIDFSLCVIIWQMTISTFLRYFSNFLSWMCFFLIHHLIKDFHILHCCLFSFACWGRVSSNVANVTAVSMQMIHKLQTHGFWTNVTLDSSVIKREISCWHASGAIQSQSNIVNHHTPFLSVWQGGIETGTMARIVSTSLILPETPEDAHGSFTSRLHVSPSIIGH